MNAFEQFINPEMLDSSKVGTELHFSSPTPSIFESSEPSIDYYQAQPSFEMDWNSVIRLPAGPSQEEPSISPYSHDWTSSTNASSPYTYGPVNPTVQTPSLEIARLHQQHLGETSPSSEIGGLASNKRLNNAASARNVKRLKTNATNANPVTSPSSSRSKPSSNLSQFPTPSPSSAEPPVTPRSAKGEHDLINIEIKRLRCQERLSWDQIIDTLTTRFGARWTVATVYGRFKRNAPLIAQSEGEDDFDINDWMHMAPSPSGKLKKRKREAGEQGVDEEDGGKKRIALHTEEDSIFLEIHQEATSEMWTSLAKKMGQATGRVWTAEECKKRMKELEM